MIESIKSLMDQYELVTWGYILSEGPTVVRMTFDDNGETFTTMFLLSGIDQETLLSLIEEDTCNGIRGRFLDSWYEKQGRTLYDAQMREFAEEHYDSIS